MTTTLSQYRAALKDWQDVPVIRIWLESVIAKLDSANEGQNSPINQCLQG